MRMILQKKMVQRTEFRNLMYELYKEDYSKHTGMIWEYDYFFSHYTALEYYVEKAYIELRKRKIQKIINGLQQMR